MKFKGLTDWFEIFKTGIWTDAAGNTREWTTEDLDTLIENYNPEEAEVPLVIGHPKTDSPAYGWAKEIKRVGEILFAKGKEIAEEFEDMVREGRFKKRSVRLTPDGTRLVHIGFLGAAPPAVQGLKNIAFQEEKQGITIEFNETSPWMFETIARIFRLLRDWLIEKEGKDKADAIIPDWDVEYIKEEARAGEEESGTAFNANAKTKEESMSIKDSIKGLLGSLGVDMSKVPDDALPEDIEAKSFSEAEVQAREKAAADKAAAEAATKTKEDAKREFAEGRRKERIEKRKGEIKDYCENLKEEGKLIPAWEKLGLQEFMLNLDGEEVIEFAAEKKVSRLDWFKDFMDELPKVINFEEIATRDQDVGAGSAAEKLTTLVKEKMSKDKDLSFTQAFNAVQVENPDLAKEYQQELGIEEKK